MNAVGIDVSKGKSTVAVIQPFRVVIAEPFDVLHTDSDLKKLADFIKSLSGETKVVMEYTGTYYEPIVNVLHNEGIFVSVVNPLLIDDYGGNRVRKVETDKNITIINFLTCKSPLGKDISNNSVMSNSPHPLTSIRCFASSAFFRFSRLFSDSQGFFQILPLHPSYRIPYNSNQADRLMWQEDIFLFFLRYSNDEHSPNSAHFLTNL